MTPQGILTAVLDIAYLAVFVVTLRDYLRRRERVGRAVVATFGSLAIVLGASAVRAVVPSAAALLGLVSLAAFLAQPLLALWLVHHFRPVPRPIFIAGIAALLALSGAATAVGAAGGGRSDSVTAALLLGLLGYFLAFELAAAVGFGLEAHRRAGTSRARLMIASISTGAFGAAVGILITAGSAAAGTGSADGVTIAVLLLALLAAAGYLAAFSPPRWLRRLSQQTIAYDFLRDLNALPDQGSVEPTWSLLSQTALRASGARHTAVLLEGPAASTTDRGGERLIEVPLPHGLWPQAVLELAIAGSPLFVEDDLELIGLLSAQAVQSAERKELEADRERLIADLRAASAAKSDFLASMSHELRTPLNAIIGFSELLVEPGRSVDEPTRVEYAGHIHASGLHLLELINDVLDLAKVEAGRLDLKPVAFDLEALARQTVETMRPLADRKALEITVTGAEHAWLVADPARIRQVAFNLLSNAIKFTPAQGRVRVSIDVDDAEARLTVADTGPGIAATDLGRIFEAFEQGGRSAASQTEGTGLGLALTRRLVEAHGGRVEVASVLGVGSEFVVHLPLGAGTESRTVPAVPATGEPTVLVVEDDRAAAELLRHYLQAAGYAVVTTASGNDSVTWAAEHAPDAIVLDILLPDTDGWEVLQRLKRDPATRDIPVLVVSVVDDRPLGLALGAVDYFVKPVARESLLAALGRLTFTTKVKTRTVTALVIDADPAAGGRYRGLLEPEGFRVVTAADGAAGCEQAKALQPDLVLLDVLLPDIDGFEVVARLKGDPATRSIPIWVTTPPDLDAAAKARLNGNVLGVAERGDLAMAALRQWLNPKAPTGGAP